MRGGDEIGARSRWPAGDRAAGSDRGRCPLYNQLENEGFEEWEDEDPVDWRNVSGEIDERGKAHEGSAAAMLNAVGGVAETTLAQEVSLENEDAPIVPNAEYELAFAAVLDEGSSNQATSPPDAYGQTVWKDALGTTAGVDQVSVTNTDDYEEYAKTFRAPANATAADIQFHLVRDNANDRTDANLKVDAAAFGPADPTAVLA